jgi:hypothetical protein
VIRGRRYGSNVSKDFGKCCYRWADQEDFESSLHNVC